MTPAARALAKLRKVIVGDGMGARLAHGGAVALAIRTMSVAISYVMFVVLARHMTKDAYGQFGFAFSLAAFIAIIAALGQPMLVLRLVPVYQHEGRLPLLKGLIRDSRVAVLLGGCICAALMILVTIIWSEIVDAQVLYLLWGALLMVAMAVGRHQAYTIRALGKIALALAPRDILWRLAVIVCVLVLARYESTISTSSAISICSLTLLVTLAIQMVAHPATRPGALLERELETDRSLWVSASLGLWAVTVVQAAGPNLSVVLLGLTLSPEETGPFFAAMKTATLMNLPLIAGNIVAAPLISRFYHAKQIANVQKISNYLVLAITAPLLAGFLVIVIFGGQILSWFGPGFANADSAMTIIALGYLVNGLCGPTAFLMTMTGHHTRYLIILCSSQVVALAILPVAALYFGILGAAWAVASAMVSWNLWVWLWARKNLGVDPTLFGVLQSIRNWLKGTEPADGNA